MQAIIYSRGIPIGTADLKIGDETMGHIFGEFIPNDEYFQKVQKYVWKFWADEVKDFNEVKSLQFKVQLENGVIVYNVGGITIDDLEELPDEPKRIDIAGIDWEILKANFDI